VAAAETPRKSKLDWQKGGVGGWADGRLLALVCAEHLLNVFAAIFVCGFEIEKTLAELVDLAL
jgi:hypothetical protein